MTNEEALRCVKKGRYAEADELIIEALEKQIPMRPAKRIVNRGYALPMPWEITVCPVCGVEYFDFNPNPREIGRDMDFCPDCGQRILWEEEVEE